ncbi:MAG TPA: hypothetical protein VGL46_13430 [Pseudonocardiaceae bacterium]|jgi:hypothetical protein
MSKEDRAQHRADVAAYYRQQGIADDKVPRRYREHTAPPEPAPAPPIDPANPYAGLDRSLLSADERATLDTAEQLGTIRNAPGYQEARQADRDAHEAASREADEQRQKNYQYSEELRNTKRMHADTYRANNNLRKANSMTHKDDIIAALTSAQDTLVNQAGAQIQRAVELMDEAKGMLAGAQQSIAGSTGFVESAYVDSTLSGSLSAMASDTETAAGAVASAREDVNGLLLGVSTVNSQFDETIAREQAIGQ